MLSQYKVQVFGLTCEASWAEHLVALDCHRKANRSRPKWGIAWASLELQVKALIDANLRRMKSNRKHAKELNKIVLKYGKKGVVDTM